MLPGSGQLRTLNCRRHAVRRCESPVLCQPVFSRGVSPSFGDSEARTQPRVALEAGLPVSGRGALTCLPWTSPAGFGGARTPALSAKGGRVQPLCPATMGSASGSWALEGRVGVGGKRDMASFRHQLEGSFSCMCTLLFSLLLLGVGFSLHFFHCLPNL